MKLKTNIFFVLVLFIVISNSSIAQKYYEVNLELIGGVNYTNLRGDSQYKYLPKPGLTIGLGYTYNFTQLLAIHSEVVYSKKQYQIPWGIEWVFEYLDIPLLLQFTFPIGNANPSTINTHINFGPYVSILLSDEIAYIIHDIDFGLLIGGGFGFRIENYQLGVDLRYHYGLHNINKSSYSYWGDDIKLDSIVLLLKFGLNFLPNDD
jgi:hypothetical protein